MCSCDIDNTCLEHQFLEQRFPELLQFWRALDSTQEGARIAAMERKA